MVEQRIYNFFGNVQGVGFRWTAWNIAKDHDVSGYVRNMVDGSVECVVEGKSDKIDVFVESLKNTMGTYIRKTTCQKAPASGRYADFSIKY